MFIISAGREELLTEHALVWNKRKIIRMPAVLAKRYIQVSGVHSIVSNSLLICYLRNSKGERHVICFLFLFIY